MSVGRTNGLLKVDDKTSIVFTNTVTGYEEGDSSITYACPYLDLSEFYDITGTIRSPNYMSTGDYVANSMAQPRSVQGQNFGTQYFARTDPVKRLGSGCTLNVRKTSSTTRYYWKTVEYRMGETHQVSGVEVYGNRKKKVRFYMQLRALDANYDIATGISPIFTSAGINGTLDLDSMELTLSPSGGRTSFNIYLGGSNIDNINGKYGILTGVAYMAD